jgi:hypothetical protein
LHGKTVIRSGWGIYKGEAQISDLTNANENLQNRFSLTRLNFPTLSFPAESLFPQAILQSTTPRAQQRRRENPTVGQWGLQVQKTIAPVAAIRSLRRRGPIRSVGVGNCNGRYRFRRTRRKSEARQSTNRRIGFGRNR